MEAKLNFQPVIDLTEEQFFEFCQLNRDMRIERSAAGEVVVMPPTGGATGAQNAEITMQLGLWTKRDGTGVAFDSSTGFVLPDRSIRSPDGAWVARWRYDALTEAQKDRFLPLCPEFVIELKSPSDYLPSLQQKMELYIEHGTQLGWLIVPEQKIVEIYRPQLAVEMRENLNDLSADPTLPGFVLNLSEIW